MSDVRRVKREMGVLPDSSDEPAGQGDWIDLEDWDEDDGEEVEECIVIS